MMYDARFHRAVLLMTAGLAAFVCSGARGAESPIPSDRRTVLGREADCFTIDGEPTFLLGISYYAGLGASHETLERDLDGFHRQGFNWLRVFATWDSFGENVSALDGDGNGRAMYLKRLQTLVDECDRRGMIVDVTLARSSREESVHLRNLAAHRKAIHTVAEALPPHRNWYLDLANERDVRDDRFVPVAELTELRRMARSLEPSLLVTASFGGHDLSRSDVRDAIETARCDFLAVHRPRHPGTAGETEARTRELRVLLNERKLVAPIHHQEPFRRGYTDWQPTAEDFVADLRGAIAGGAAGWCFHNGSTRGVEDGRPRRSFDLREKPLIEQLDGEEQKFFRRAKDVLPAPK